MRTSTWLALPPVQWRGRDGVARQTALTVERDGDRVQICLWADGVRRDAGPEVAISGTRTELQQLAATLTAAVEG